MMNDEELGIGYIYFQQIRKGVTDFNQIADVLQAKRESMADSNTLTYNKFIQNGSNNVGVIMDDKHNDGEKIVYCVNHYLGLNRNKEVIESSVEALRKYGTGCGTSASSGGRNELHYKIEQRIANLLQKEAAVLFPTGYTTNIGAISSIVLRNDLIIADKEVHSSVINGIKLAKCKSVFFDHNSIESLESKLKAYNGDGNILVVVESAYSMSGNLAPLKEIVELKKKYNFYLYVDESHTFGLYGEKGRGLSSQEGVLEDIDFYMSTLSKSCASIGGFLATKRKYETLIMSKASSYMFQACLTPADAATILKSLEIIESNPEIAKDLHEKNKYFRGKLTDCGFNLGNSKSPIIPIYISDVKTLEKFGKDLYDEGIFAVCIIFPAVSPLDGRIRLILNKSHTYDEIDRTIDILTKLGKKYKIIA